MNGIKGAFELDEEALEEVDDFTYFENVILKNKIRQRSGKKRVGKARITSLQLGKIWKSRRLTIKSMAMKISFVGRKRVMENVKRIRSRSL